MPEKTPVAGQRLAYTPREAARISPWGYERMLGFIASGELKASRRQDSDGKPVGPFIIMHEDLVAFLDSIPAA